MPFIFLMKAIDLQAEWVLPTASGSSSEECGNEMLANKSAL